MKAVAKFMENLLISKLTYELILVSLTQILTYYSVFNDITEFQIVISTFKWDLTCSVLLLLLYTEVIILCIYLRERRFCYHNYECNLSNFIHFVRFKCDNFRGPARCCIAIRGSSDTFLWRQSVGGQNGLRDIYTIDICPTSIYKNTQN